ncbi:MAG: N4-gp56 family major capsid protein [Hominilimicola sp.]
MAINYASKYAQKIDEKFTRESMTSPAVNNDYDFVGVKTVNVYSVPTAPMNDYSVTGTSRYGTPEELDNTVQELTMSMDRSFTFTIDRGTYNDTQMSNAAGAALQRQLREVVIPEIDKYRFGKIVEGAGTTITGTISKTTAYDAFLTGASELIENNVPLTGCTAFVSSNFYKNIKEDSSFIRNGDMSQDILIKGQVGTIDGIPVIVVPKSYFPEGVEFIITNQAATTAPVKLSEYKIHDNPPGINGWLVEGRVYYDAFVLDNKKDAIYVFKNATTESDGE